MALTPHSERAKELIKQFPEHGSRSLALMLMEEFNDTISENAARNAIRYWRGAKGKLNRASAGIKEPVKTAHSKPYTLPEPKREFDDWAFHKLKARRVLVLSDVHVPYFDKEALGLAIDAGLDAGVDAVLLNGDFMDFYTVSHWLKDPRKRDFKGEIDMGREMLQMLRETFKGCQIWWKLGNHEERWQAFMWNKAPEIAGVEDFHIPAFMRCDQFNIKVIDRMQPIEVNRLKVLHGHEYRFAISNPVNPARGLYLRAKVPAMMGHLHQSSEHTETNLNGTICTCWSMGCLCDMRPSYAPLNKWNSGYSIVDTTGEEDFVVHNKRIWRGRVL